MVDIARDDDLAVNSGSRCNQRVRYRTRPLRGGPSPFEWDAIANRQDPLAVVVSQLLEPHRQRRRGSGIGSTLERDPLHDLAKGHDTEVDGARIDRTQPSPCLVAASASFGQ